MIEVLTDQIHKISCPKVTISPVDLTFDIEIPEKSYGVTIQ